MAAQDANGAASLIPGGVVWAGCVTLQLQAGSHRNLKHQRNGQLGSCLGVDLCFSQGFMACWGVVADRVGRQSQVWAVSLPAASHPQLGADPEELEWHSRHSSKPGSSWSWGALSTPGKTKRSCVLALEDTVALSTANKVPLDTL